MLASKFRLFQHKVLSFLICREHNDRPPKTLSDLAIDSWMARECTWNPSLVIKFIVSSIEDLNSRRHSRLWIYPERIKLEQEAFDLGLSSHLPNENMQRMNYFPRLGEAHRYTVAHWNLLALSSFLDNYFCWSNRGMSGKMLQPKHLRQMICLQSMKSVIDGFVDSFIIESKDSTLGYLECYLILRRLSQQEK